MASADVVVIGAGLAGLSCAAELVERGARVFLAAKGMATTHWTHGGIDVAATQGARSARDGVERLGAVAGHPYARLGDEVEPALDRQLARLASAGLPYVGGLDTPLVPVPTAIGTLRPAALLPRGQASAAEPWDGDGLLLVGFGRYRDAWAPYATRNLVAANWPGGPREVRAAVVDLPWVARLHNLNGLTLARLFDDPMWRGRALAAVAAAIPAGRWRIGMPAVLGIERHREALAEAEATLGARVFEVTSLPPSVPGMRLFEALRRRILDGGGRIQVGFDVTAVEREADHVLAIHTDAASRTLRLVAGTFVLATGGIAGAGFRAGRDGRLEERVFDLRVTAPPRDAWFSDDPLTPHPLEAAGIEVDDAMTPEGLANVRVIGSALAGMHYLDQRCGDGVALASAHRVARSLASPREMAA
jgi:glycerol-3-phosphate dehydrogenase subunit B